MSQPRTGTLTIDLFLIEESAKNVFSFPVTKDELDEHIVKVACRGDRVEFHDGEDLGWFHDGAGYIKERIIPFIREDN